MVCSLCRIRFSYLVFFPDDEESDEEAVKKTNKCVLVWEVSELLHSTKLEPRQFLLVYTQLVKSSRAAEWQKVNL